VSALQSGGEAIRNLFGNQNTVIHDKIGKGKTVRNLFGNQNTTIHDKTGRGKAIHDNWQG
jgi:hypothetical protein